MTDRELPEPAALADLVERLLAGTGGGKHWMDLHEEAAGAIQQLGAALAAVEAAVAAERGRWERALGAEMPADFKSWHQNAASERPEVAAWVIRNLREREALAWHTVDAAVAAERERWDGLARQTLEVMENYRSEHAQSRITGLVYTLRERLDKLKSL